MWKGLEWGKLGFKSFLLPTPSLEMGFRRYRGGLNMISGHCALTSDTWWEAFATDWGTSNARGREKEGGRERKRGKQSCNRETLQSRPAGREKYARVVDKEKKVFLEPLENLTKGSPMKQRHSYRESGWAPFLTETVYTI